MTKMYLILEMFFINFNQIKRAKNEILMIYFI
jgi:hypothetical protein